ncbi:uncharacterized protein LOC134744161 isoform X1 [Cydia strobilella]|uniref:uncharacterized protein LOC134744161 isoform X1 n=1 Tax=Cydia strobilella TaxID=1100964 RepID=UPI003003ED85
MINILSYVGMNVQSEVCLWTILGLLRTIFDATLFKVNANLKQVWQMNMPAEISMPVQRVLRTMISGIMLVQCFTVYIYLATYIVLLYPAFLEERPTLVLPWLLMAAIRKLLCELLSLALGLGTCVLVGAARPPCIKFVIVKIASIMPSVYMWMLVLNYYKTLKMASVFQKFPKAVPANDLDYGLELAIRRRRTKSLLGEAQLRKRLLSNWYVERPQLPNPPALASRVTVDMPNTSSETIGDPEKNTDAASTDIASSTDNIKCSSITGTYEDYFGNEITVPRNADRITEQLVLMLLRISEYLRKTKYEGIELFESHQVLVSSSNAIVNFETCPALNNQTDDNPPLVGSSKENTASYLRLYPQIFMKGSSDYQTLRNFDSIRTVQSSIISKFTETSEQLPIAAVSRKNTILMKEKATNIVRTPSIENMEKEKNAINLSETNPEQKLKQESKTNLGEKVVKIKSHECIRPKSDLSVDSKNSLSTLITKMQSKLAEIISCRQNSQINEDSIQYPNFSYESSKAEKGNSNKGK